MIHLNTEAIHSYMLLESRENECVKRCCITCDHQPNLTKQTVKSRKLVYGQECERKHSSSRYELAGYLY